MIGKPVALIQIPNQRLFSPRSAAKYLDIDTETLRKLTAEGVLRAFNFRGRRAYRLEDLEGFVESLGEWKNGAGGKPVTAHLKECVDAS